MDSAIGFTVIRNGNETMFSRVTTAQKRAVSYFSDIKQEVIDIGETKLFWWGRDDLIECLHTLPDQSKLLLIGSPAGNYSWKEIEERITNCSRLKDFRLPWDGRVNLIHISSTGDQWTLWNDFLGSIPVFYAQSSQSRIASTLEPSIVSAYGFSSQNFFLPGILFMMMHGHYLADWTLYKDMKVVLPDVAISWKENTVQWDRCDSVPSSEERWESRWDDLIDELHNLVLKAMTSALKRDQSYILPLSSGLDSRLIASAGTEIGVKFKAFTWGPLTTRDSVYSRSIAKTLGIPWKRIDLGDQYLEKYVPLWCALFGSSMQFHGTYQIPFLERLRTESPGKIVSGFIGDLVSWYIYVPEAQARKQDKFYVMPEGWVHLKVEELRSLIRFPIDHELEQIADEINSQVYQVQGHWFQREIFQCMRSRQHYWTYFQSMMADYWRGVVTPFINREYARFFFSLPLIALDQRRLLVDMMRRYYAKIMTIPGSFTPEPAILTGRYLLKRRVSKMLPSSISRHLLPEFFSTELLNADIKTLRDCGRNGIWPIPQTEALLKEWVNLDQIEKYYSDALAGDMHSVRKLQSIQTFAYRLGKQNPDCVE